MVPAERTQVDGLEDEYSLLTGTDTGTDTATRQEMKDESDINILLARFGVNTPIRGGLDYGAEIDYNMDLQQALGAIESARRANTAVPEELREKYPTWREVLNGAETGEYQKDLQTLATDKAIEAEQMKTAQRLADALEDSKIKRRAELTMKRQAEDARLAESDTE